MKAVGDAHGVALKAVYEHYALQKVDELTFILHLLDDRDLVVEIGCDAGGTSWAIQQMEPQVHVGIDLPGERYSSGLAWQGNTNSIMIWGDSHAKETSIRLREVLDKRSIDVLIIDGDHSYWGVSEDFRMYAKLCTGLVIFHDICQHQGIPDCKVDQFYNEIKGRYPHVEYISPNDDSWGGIGVLDVSGNDRLARTFK